jgi:hypothetical protein
MTDRVVVLRDDDGLSFVADACATLADSVNGIRAARRSDEDLVGVYAEMVRAYARLIRPRLIAKGETVRLAILDHLLERLDQAQTGARAVPVVDIVDRLHGELEREHSLV